MATGCRHLFGANWCAGSGRGLAAARRWRSSPRSTARWPCGRGTRRPRPGVRRRRHLEPSAKTVVTALAGQALIERAAADSAMPLGVSQVLLGLGGPSPRRAPGGGTRVGYRRHRHGPGGAASRGGPASGAPSSNSAGSNGATLAPSPDRTVARDPAMSVGPLIYRRACERFGYACWRWRRRAVRWSPVTREAGPDPWKAYMRRQDCSVNYGRDVPHVHGVRAFFGTSTSGIFLAQRNLYRVSIRLADARRTQV